jgi:hypothetical protein
MELPFVIRVARALVVAPLVSVRRRGIYRASEAEVVARLEDPVSSKEERHLLVRLGQVATPVGVGVLRERSVGGSDEVRATAVHGLMEYAIRTKTDEAFALLVPALAWPDTRMVTPVALVVASYAPRASPAFLAEIAPALRATIPRIGAAVYSGPRRGRRSAIRTLVYIMHRWGAADPSVSMAARHELEAAVQRMPRSRRRGIRRALAWTPQGRGRL